MRYFAEEIAGAANKTVFGSGLGSVEAEQKLLRTLDVVFDTGQGSLLEGWYEREQQFSCYDHNVSLIGEDFAKTWDFEFPIPPGKIWKAAVTCGGTPNTAYVVYGYELT